MKKIIFSLMLVFIFAEIFGQTEAGKTFSKDYYLKKSKTQKKVAWILLTGGTIMAVAGAISFSESWDSDSYTTTDISGFIMLAGIVSDIVSIPFFISSAKNKRRALSVAISNQKIFVPQQKGYALNKQPALTLKFGL